MPYITFLAIFDAKEIVVDDNEHTTFLFYWLCQLLFYSPLLKVEKDYIKLVICLPWVHK